MPIIRYKHNYGHIMLTTGGMLRNTKCVNRGRVRCTDLDDQEHYLEFRGFTSELRAYHFERVTMHDVTGITGDKTGLSGWVDLKGYYIGVWCDDGVYLALDATGYPVEDKDYTPPKKAPGVVIDLARVRKLR
ncbi:hypothetical protein [Pseudoalteromonas rubra]|uniref:hypothetical protein n=1 Tax=Pseudoalteromonas rubra TaxID=43658 RepID=UPI002DBA6069|nr:hypothetical protein [Pseudoalteromonas rubra]MEC4091854.1 hypothetical protein [Pseudoalteromonas rubra]